MRESKFTVKKMLKYSLVCLILFALASIYLGCANKMTTPIEVPPPSTSPPIDKPSSTEPEKPSTQSLSDYIKNLSKPVIVDFGSTSCIPCKMMEPILEELKLNYSNKFETIFVNVTKDIETTREFGINVIPTQIFFDATGKEFYRHIGFFSKEEILNTFKSYGIPIQ